MKAGITHKVPLCLPYITQDDKDGVIETIESQWLTGGNKTVEFENKFADYIGAKYAVAVNSCTAGLHLAMRTLNIKKGDEVIVPTMTFAATANAPVFCGATPVFADVDEDTLNISPVSIKEKITEKTKAIIVVHIAGQPCDMSRILPIALDNGICLVEDCAHSLGATFRKIQTGMMSDMSCFSFYPTKPITVGEGGMVVTNHEPYYKKLKSLRSHAMTKEAFERSNTNKWQYDVVDVGYNYRMSEISASLGVTQLEKVDFMNALRFGLSEYYTKNLSDINGIKTPIEVKDSISSNHLYIIRVDKEKYGMSRDELFVKLAENGIECSVHYRPLNLMTYYSEKYGAKKGDCPVAEKVYEEILTLPLYPSLSLEKIDYVVDNIRKFAK